MSSSVAESNGKLQGEAALLGLSLLGPGRSSAYRKYRFSSCGHEQELATTAVRQGRFRCRLCLEAKVVEEAATNGMVLIESASRIGPYRRYRFLACGHEVEAQVTHVRRVNVRCGQCTAAKHETEATCVGVEILGPGSSAHTRWYRFTVCGHAQEAHVSAVRQGRVRCQACLEQRFGEEARAKAMALLGPGSQAKLRTYCFNLCGHEFQCMPATIRSGNVGCPACTDERHRIESDSENVTEIGSGHQSAYRMYRFDLCGHERELTRAAVRRGHVRCQLCFNQRLEDEAAQEGLALLGAAKQPTYRKYKFIACGHEREMSSAAVRVGHVRCKACLEQEIARSAAEHGLTVVGLGRDANYRSFRFDACGHVRELSPIAVRRGVSFCRECFDASLEQQASAAGVEILGPGTRPKYRKYRFLACGHQQEMQAVHVRLEGFHCQTCNDSVWNGQGNVYVVALSRAEERIFKVGLAKSVKGRVSRYGLKDEVDVEVAHTKLFAQYRIAHEREQGLHAALRIAGYGLAQTKAREFLTSGFTECYSDVPEDIAEKVLGSLRV